MTQDASIIDLSKTSPKSSLWKWISRIFRTLRFLIIFLFFTLGVFLSVWLYLPKFLENQVLPQVVSQFELQNIELNFQDIGLFSAGVGPIVMGKDQYKQVCVENVRAHYNPFTLFLDWWNERPIIIPKIEVSSVFLSANYNDSGFELNCSEWEKIQKLCMTSFNLNHEMTSSTSLPIDIAEIELKRANLILNYYGRYYWVYTDISVKTPLTSPQISGIVFAQRQALKFNIAKDTDFCGLPEFAPWRIDYRVVANLQDLNDFIPPPYTASIKGNLDLSGFVKLGEKNGKMQILSLNGQGAITGLNATLRQARNNLLSMRYERHEKLNIAFESTPKGLDFNLSPIKTRIPFGSESTLSFLLSETDTPMQLKLTGNLNSKIQNVSRMLPELKLDSAITLHSDFWASLNLCDILSSTCYLSSHISTPPQINFEGVNVQVSDSMVFSARWGKTPMDESPQHYLDAELKIPSITAQQDDLWVKIPSTLFHAKTDVDFTQFTGSLVPEKILLNANQDIQLLADTVAIDFELPLGGFTSQTPFLAHIDFAGRLHHPQAEVGSIALSVPFAWPAISDTNVMSAGYIDMQKLIFDHRDFGKVSGDIVQENLRYRIEGAMTASKYDLAINYNVALGMFEGLNGGYRFGMKTQLEFPEQQLPHQMDLGYFAKPLSGYQFDGALQLNAYYPLFIPREYPSFQLSLDSGNLKTPDDLSVSKIQTHLTLYGDEYGRWSTPNGQSLSVGRFQFAQLDATDIYLNFRLEDNGDFIIEGLSLNCCGGSISSLNTKLRATDSVYNIMLYCDRLKLKDLLTQMNVNNVATMEGDVVVSGLIPVMIKDHKPILGKGYLYTAPGVMGQLKMYTGDEYAAALPTSDPGFIQLDLSRQALQSFKYNWIKLDLGMTRDSKNPEKEQYRIALSLYGRPTEPLPFTVNAQGQLINLDPKSKSKGFMQDMQIDLNFNADIELLDFVFGIQNAIEKFKQKLAESSL